MTPVGQIERAYVDSGVINVAATSTLPTLPILVVKVHNAAATPFSEGGPGLPDDGQSRKLPHIDGILRDRIAWIV